MLAERGASKPPTNVKERTLLLNAGLGEASIQFDVSMNGQKCHEIITEKFPKLKEAGYEVLLFQRGQDGGFFSIEGPYTPRRLKDAAGSAKIYLRPLQKDLDLGNINVENEVYYAYFKYMHISIPMYPFNFTLKYYLFTQLIIIVHFFALSQIHGQWLISITYSLLQ